MSEEKAEANRNVDTKTTLLPYGAAVGALIKPSAVVGNMESPFLSCDRAPIRYTFCSIIAPVIVVLNSMIAAKTVANPDVYSNDVLIAGGDDRPFYESLEKLDYSSPEVRDAKDCFLTLTAGIIEESGL